MQVCNGSKTREAIPDPHTNDEKFIYSESDLIKRTIERAFFKRTFASCKKVVYCFNKDPFIEIKFEILQVYSLIGGRYFHVINMIPLATEAPSLTRKYILRD